MTVDNKPTLMIAVETFDAVSGDVINRLIIDHNNPDSRKWLGKHCFWAVRNGRGIRTYPAK